MADRSENFNTSDKAIKELRRIGKRSNGSDGVNLNFEAYAAIGELLYGIDNVLTEILQAIEATHQTGY